MKKFRKNLASVVCHEGRHHIVLPSGDLLPCIVSTNVSEYKNELAEVTVVIKANISESIEDAKRKYKDDELVCKINGDDLHLTLDKSLSNLGWRSDGLGRIVYVGNKERSK